MSEACVALPTSGQSVRRALAAAPRFFAGLVTLAVSLFATAAGASEADLTIPDLGSVNFVGMSGHNLLLFGLIICIGGMAFGLVQYMQIRKLPVHRAMLEISEIIYETCKTYLITQGKFIAILWVFIAVIMVVYFGHCCTSRSTGSC